MRRLVRYAFIILVVAFIAAQFVPVDRTNPAIDQKKTIENAMGLPPHVKTLIDRSCKDCHSNDTHWPLYSHVFPGSWLMAHDVREGREQMNFSEWGDYDADEQRDILVDICRQVRKGAMPISQYTLLHRSARLTSADVETLCRWTDDARNALPPPAE
jgi:hypothetical protein